MKGPQGGDLFADCLSELVMESQEFESILGRMQTNGTRKPGAVDKFQTDTSEVIRLVARGAEERGLYEDAVRLYDLAQVRKGVWSEGLYKGGKAFNCTLYSFLVFPLGNFEPFLLSRQPYAIHPLVYHMISLSLPRTISTHSCMT